MFEDHVKMVNDHFEFKGYILTTSYLNVTAVKSQFINRLIDNINKRLLIKYSIS